MAVAAAATDNRATVARSDSAALIHLLVSSLFLGLGGVLYLLALIARAYPGLFEGYFSAGRLRPLTFAVVMIGWLVPALAGATYYVLPRLTGAALWNESLVALSVWAYGGVTLAGAAAVFLGFGDGAMPLGFPWWIDIVVLAVVSIPAVVAVQTVRNRSEAGVYPTLWFVLAGTAWLPTIYLLATVPGLNSVSRSLQEVTFSSGFGSLWVLAVGTGVAYYTVAKASGAPLANRQLARVGFWSLAAAAAWAGPAQLAYGPTPSWLDQVAAVLTLALPVAALANAMANALTAEDSLAEPSPALRATMWGLGLAVIAALFTAVGSFRSSAALVAFTDFWDGIEYLMLFGAGGLLVAGWAYQALPAMTGLELPSESIPRRHITLTVVGTLATAAVLMVAGVLSGYLWAGGSFTGAFADAGDGWTSAGQTLLIVGVMTSAVTVAGQFVFVYAVFKTLTSGVGRAREVFVTLGAGDE